MTGVYILQNQWQEEWVKKKHREELEWQITLGKNNNEGKKQSEEERKRNKISFLWEEQ